MLKITKILKILKIFVVEISLRFIKKFIFEEMSQFTIAALFWQKI